MGNVCGKHLGTHLTTTRILIGSIELLSINQARGQVEISMRETGNKAISSFVYLFLIAVAFERFPESFPNKFFIN